MIESEKFSTTKIVLPWRARVLEKAANKVGVTTEEVAGPGEIVIISGGEPTTVEQNHIAIQIRSNPEQNFRFVKKDKDLLDRINYIKLTFNPLLIPFIWSTRNRRRKEEKPLRRRAARRHSS